MYGREKSEEVRRRVRWWLVPFRLAPPPLFLPEVDEVRADGGDDGRYLHVRAGGGFNVTRLFVHSHSFGFNNPLCQCRSSISVSEQERYH
jgi:hypothetical protein